METNPYAVVKSFEAELCRYTGAPFAVTTNSCTSALMLAVAWHLQQTNVIDSIARVGFLQKRVWGGVYENAPAVEIPKRTYVSVGMAIVHAGGAPTFRDEEWQGAYQLKPLPVWDCARRFTSGMYAGKRIAKNVDPVFLPGASYDPVNWAGHMMCCSFQAAKILSDTQGGTILHDNAEADAWLRRARFDGRTEGVAPKDDTFTQIGWHCYMSNDVAARLLLKLYSLPKHNADLPNDDYADLSAMEIFK